MVGLGLVHISEDGENTGLMKYEGVGKFDVQSSR